MSNKKTAKRKRELPDIKYGFEYRLVVVVCSFAFFVMGGKIENLKT